MWRNSQGFLACISIQLTKRGIFITKNELSCSLNNSMNISQQEILMKITRILKLRMTLNLCLTLLVLSPLPTVAQTPISVVSDQDLKQVILDANVSALDSVFFTIDTSNDTLFISEDMPVLVGQIELVTPPGSGPIIIQSSPQHSGPFIRIHEGGEFINNSGDVPTTFRGFSNPENGGVFAIENGGSLNLKGGIFENNSSAQSGGSVYCASGSTCEFDQSHFRESSGLFGGAIACHGNCSVSNSQFNDNTASQFGCDLDVPFGGTTTFAQNIIRNYDFSAGCQTDSIESNGGVVWIIDSFIEFDRKRPIFNSTGELTVIGSEFVNGEFKRKNETEIKALCNDFGTGAITSNGYNVDSGNGCFLNHATDLQNTDALVTFDEAGHPILQSNSPSVESAKSTFSNNVLPCAYKDIAGLARPQDFDGDGVFTCDRGPIELQGGDDLTFAQSGLFYDVDRNGEGIIIEMLSADTAVITMFTYHPNKSELMWLIGVGKVKGNSIVTDDLIRTKGGKFGSGFDAQAIENEYIGGMSVIFPNCEATEKAGRLVVQTNNKYKAEIENLLNKNTRLSSMLSCNQTQSNPLSGRSGSFFDPLRSGEGVFVEVLGNGNAVLIFYTYTPDGKQFWTISSDVQISGNTLTAQMIYAANTTGFGSEFIADEINFLPWGTITMEYKTGCNDVDFSYNSSINGFGSGALNYKRLTQLAGLTCDL